MTDSDDEPTPLTLAESIRRKIAEAQNADAQRPRAESKQASSASGDEPTLMTLAESIRRKIAEAQNAEAQPPRAESKEASDEPLEESEGLPDWAKNDFLKQFRDSEPQAGSVLGIYNLLTLLHSGNSARIFEAKHQLLDRKLAIKILKNEHLRDTVMVRRLQEEARALSAMKSPHVVEVHDFGISTTGYPYTILEFVEAPSLEQLLISKRLPVTLCIQIIEQVGEVFSDAHKHSIKYANLKPAHVLVEKTSDSEVCVKLVDFSSLEREHGLPPVSPTLDVAPYASPEQFSDAPVQVQSDIYSLACLAFELLTGAPPFRENSLEDYSQAHTTKPLQKADSLSDQVYKVLSKALDKDPGRRHETVKEFVTDLKNALSLGR